MSVGKDDDRLSREETHRRVIGRWENEGGSVRAWHREIPAEEKPATVAGEIGDAEAANIRVRLIAIENMGCRVEHRGGVPGPRRADFRISTAPI